MIDKVFRVSTGALNIRAEPSSRSGILTALPAGQAVARLDEMDRNGWWLVFADTPGDGLYVGYVAARFLTPITSMTGMEVPAPAPATALETAAGSGSTQPAPPPEGEVQPRPAPPSPVAPPAGLVIDSSSPDYPPRPDFAALNSDEGRRAIFGEFAYVPDPQPDDREHIRVTDGWDRVNITMVEIPQLRRVDPRYHRIQFHRLAEAQLKGLWAEWEERGLLDRIHSFAGGYAPRFKRGMPGVLSNHAFGTAFDINVDCNALGATPALFGRRGCVRELVPVAHKWGFFWGGHFEQRPDGMHFEVAKLLNATIT